MLKESDVVVQILDARDPLRCRSTSLDEAVKGKKVLYVLTKIGMYRDSLHSVLLV